MAKTMFTTSGTKAPTLPGRPNSMKKSSKTSPGTSIVGGFDSAKNYARMTSMSQSGSYTPLDRPARIAERSVFPVAAVGMGLGDKGI